MRTIGRVLLGIFLVGAGVSHFTFLREAFQAQVPPWLPFEKDFVVLASGAVEIVLGLAVLVLPASPGPFGVAWRHWIGWIVGAFFVAIFPGNISQLVDSLAAVGVEGSTQWIVRLFFQPLLVAWALWSTGAFAAGVEQRRRRRRVSRP